MRHVRWVRLILALGLASASAALVLSPSGARANVVVPGATVAPDNFTGAPAGTLLASLSAPFSTATFAGTLKSAVFRTAGGTLDFYYQLANNAPSTDSLGR